jgi:serine/threonine-protein kinase RIO1
MENRVYENLNSVLTDIYKMYENCELYNGDDSEFAKLAKKQKKLIKTFVSKFF